MKLTKREYEYLTSIDGIKRSPPEIDNTLYSNDPSLRDVFVSSGEIFPKDFFIKFFVNEYNEIWFDCNYPDQIEEVLQRKGLVDKESYAYFYVKGFYYPFLGMLVGVKFGKRIIIREVERDWFQFGNYRDKLFLNRIARVAFDICEKLSLKPSYTGLIFPDDWLLSRARALLSGRMKREKIEAIMLDSLSNFVIKQFYIEESNISLAAEDLVEETKDCFKRYLKANLPSTYIKYPFGWKKSNTPIRDSFYNLIRQASRDGKLPKLKHHDFVVEAKKILGG